MVTVWVAPIATRPVYKTSVAVYGAGGTKKSDKLTADPPAVTSEMGPEVAWAGTVATRVVVVLDATGADVPLKLTRLFTIAGSKFIPVIVTRVPETPIRGVNVVIVGTVGPACAAGWLAVNV
jgi:hypothetical protein